MWQGQGALPRACWGLLPSQVWSDTPASLCGLGALGRGQHPAGCKSQASLLGKPGRFPSSSHPGRGGDRVCGAIRGVTAGCGLGDVRFVCGGTGSVIMSLGQAMDIIKHAGFFPRRQVSGKYVLKICPDVLVQSWVLSDCKNFQEKKFVFRYLEKRFLKMLESYGSVFCKWNLLLEDYLSI